MGQTIKIITALATLVTTLLMIGLTVFALTLPHWGLAVTCFLLAAGCTYFLYNDFLYFKAELHAKKVSQTIVKETIVELEDRS